MAIYEGSRYINVYTDEDEESRDGKIITAFRIRELLPIQTESSLKHTWVESDRLDLLANRYYGDPQYWWFILDANTRYMEEHEIRNGDILFIPPYEELARVIEDDE